TDQPTHTPDDTACDDGLFCTGVETCDVSDGCQPGSAPDLDDGVGCTIDTCDDDSDDITHTPDDTLCAPSGVCLSATCDGATGCQESLILDCCGNGLVEADEVCEPAAADCWALEFDDAHVDVGDSPSFSFGDGANDSPFSVSAWIYVTSVQDSIVASKFGNEGDKKEWIFGFQANNTFSLGLYLPGGTEQLSRTTATQEALEGAWHHVAATYDGSGGADAADGIQLYIDGVSQAVLTEKGGGYGAMTPSNQAVWIGKQSSNDFKGRIDEVRLWSRELSGEEIATKMNLSLDPGAEDGLVGYWPLNEGTGETTADASGNDHHGTLEGANWVQDCGIGSDSGAAGAVACTDTCTLNSGCGTAGIESLSECECYLASLEVDDWEHCSTPGPVCADGQAAVRQCEPRPDTACYHLTEPEACAETIATPEGDEAAAACFESATCADGACVWGSKADDDEQSCACILEALGKRTSCDVNGETLEPGDKACGENGAG
ncbi:MAG: LamG domain-containing protein, partial [Myxococcota bacterium]|nr:LamG domain-containing protein [Myxococcota bacterium]